jgi:polyisoprenoid-binding protein YceI
MPLSPGTYAIGPAEGTLQVFTYREGVAARVGHDLVIEVTDWHAQALVADDGTLAAVELTASPGSLVVREGLRGVKPLTDGDRADIRRTIEERVLAGRAIAFRSSAVEPAGEGAVAVRGDLTLGQTTRATAFTLTSAADGRVQGRATVRQTDWGIKPYRGLMGALRVRDEVEIAVDARLPAA